MILQSAKSLASSTSNRKQTRTSQSKSSAKNVQSQQLQKKHRASKPNQGQTRAIKDFTERQISATIGLDSSVLKWRVRHAGWTLATFHVGSDGMTAHQRIRGKPYKRQIAAFELVGPLLTRIHQAHRRTHHERQNSCDTMPQHLEDKLRGSREPRRVAWNPRNRMEHARVTSGSGSYTCSITQNTATSEP